MSLKANTARVIRSMVSDAQLALEQLNESIGGINDDTFDTELQGYYSHAVDDLKRVIKRGNEMLEFLKNN